MYLGKQSVIPLLRRMATIRLSLGVAGRCMGQAETSVSPQGLQFTDTADTLLPCHLLCCPAPSTYLGICFVPVGRSGFAWGVSRVHIHMPFTLAQESRWQRLIVSADTKRNLGDAPNVMLLSGLSFTRGHRKWVRAVDSHGR